MIMSSIVVSVTDMVRNFSEYVNRTAYGGDSFVLMKGQRALAELKPVVKGRTFKELQNLLKKNCQLEEDEIDCFLDDINQIRKSTNIIEKNPWE